MRRGESAGAREFHRDQGGAVAAVEVVAGVVVDVVLGEHALLPPPSVQEDRGAA